MPAINAHVTNKNNPHNLTKEDINLGLVRNLPMATTAIAEQMTSDNHYVSPLTTDVVITKTLFDMGIIDDNGNVIVTPATPLQIGAVKTPGGSLPLQGDYTHGYFGNVPDGDLISFSELVNLSEIGDVDPMGYHECTRSDTDLYSYTASYLNKVNWLKFIVNDKLIFVASHPMGRVSFNQLDAIGAILGDNEFSIKGNRYKLRLLSGNASAENIIVGGKGYRRSGILTNGDGKLSASGYPIPLRESEWDKTLMKVSEELPACQVGANWDSYHENAFISNGWDQNLVFDNPVTFRYAHKNSDEILMEVASLTTSSVGVFKRGRFDNTQTNHFQYITYVATWNPNISYYGTVNPVSRADKVLSWRPVLELIV